VRICKTVTERRQHVVDVEPLTPSPIDLCVPLLLHRHPKGSISHPRLGNRDIVDVPDLSSTRSLSALFVVE
jgi:hypothetical protein